MGGSVLLVCATKDDNWLPRNEIGAMRRWWCQPLFARARCAWIEADGELEPMRLHRRVVGEHVEGRSVGDDDAVGEDHATARTVPSA